MTYIPRSLTLLCVEYIAKKGIVYTANDIDLNSLELVKLYKENNKNWENVMEFACYKGYIDVLETMHRNNIIMSDYWNPLIKAAEYGHLNIVQYIYENIFINEKDHNAIRTIGYECVRRAAEKNYLEIVQYLACNGANVNSNFDYTSPLLMAICHGNIKMVECLINAKADVYTNCLNLLLKATEYGHIEIIKIILIDNRIINKVYSSNMIKELLQLAAENGHLEVLQYFCKMDKTGVAIHADDNYAFRYANKRGHLTTLKFIIENYGLNINLDHFGLNMVAI